jgi:hypothetical protein
MSHYQKLLIGATIARSRPSPVQTRRFAAEHAFGPMVGDAANLGL